MLPIPTKTTNTTKLFFPMPHCTIDTKNLQVVQQVLGVHLLPVVPDHQVVHLDLYYLEDQEHQDHPEWD